MGLLITIMNAAIYPLVYRIKTYRCMFSENWSWKNRALTHWQRMFGRGNRSFDISDIGKGITSVGDRQTNSQLARRLNKTSAYTLMRRSLKL